MFIPDFIFGILFAVLKEKSAKLVSGFNSMPKKKQEKYDKAYIARDMRNQCFVRSAIMLAGAILSLFVSKYMAILVILMAGAALALPRTFAGIAPHVSILLGIVMFGMGMTLRSFVQQQRKSNCN